jgi:hypothetical protein
VASGLEAIRSHGGRDEELYLSAENSFFEEAFMTDREFGIDINILDNPQEAAKALLTAEFVRKTKQYEPRVRVMRVEWTQNHARDGGIVPKVVVSFV